MTVYTAQSCCWETRVASSQVKQSVIDAIFDCFRHHVNRGKSNNHLLVQGDRWKELGGLNEIYYRFRAVFAYGAHTAVW